MAQHQEQVFLTQGENMIMQALGVIHQRQEVIYNRQEYMLGEIRAVQQQAQERGDNTDGLVCSLAQLVIHGGQQVNARFDALEAGVAATNEQVTDAVAQLNHGVVALQNVPRGGTGQLNHLIAQVDGLKRDLPLCVAAVGKDVKTLLGTTKEMREAQRLAEAAQKQRSDKQEATGRRIYEATDEIIAMVGENHSVLSTLLSRRTKRVDPKVQLDNDQYAILSRMYPGAVQLSDIKDIVTDDIMFIPVTICWPGAVEPKQTYDAMSAYQFMFSSFVRHKKFMHPDGRQIVPLEFTMVLDKKKYNLATNYLYFLKLRDSQAYTATRDSRVKQIADYIVKMRYANFPLLSESKIANYTGGLDPVKFTDPSTRPIYE